MVEPLMIAPTGRRRQIPRPGRPPPAGSSQESWARRTPYVSSPSEDEGYTYNNRINRLAIIQEHKMILHAIERGVPEDRLAAALNVKLDHIRRKRRLLDGICADAAALLEDKQVSINTFDTLKKMGPERQVEVAQNMVAMNKFTISYAKTFLPGRPKPNSQPARGASSPGASPTSSWFSCKGIANLDREFRLIEEFYGPDHLDLVLAKGYIGRLSAMNGSPVTSSSTTKTSCRNSFRSKSNRRRPPDPDRDLSAGTRTQQARGPQETPHGEADQVWWRRRRRTRSEFARLEIDAGTRRVRRIWVQTHEQRRAACQEAASLARARLQRSRAFSCWCKASGNLGMAIVSVRTAVLLAPCRRDACGPPF